LKLFDKYDVNKILGIDEIYIKDPLLTIEDEGPYDIKDDSFV